MDADLDALADCFPDVGGHQFLRSDGHENPGSRPSEFRARGHENSRTADADRDRYCAVVNVGNSLAFFKLATDAGLAEGDDDHIALSVFDAIDTVDSSVNLLIGSKKFIEGWSSWRVSVMGLLKVGRKAGPQVIQLFGRGVRLKGLGMLLRRSSTVPGDHPAHLPLVETLHIFGVRADYMQSFNEAVRREGIPPPVARLLPITVKSGIANHGLRYPDSGEYEFGQEVVRFDPGAFRSRKIEIDLVPRFTATHGVDTMEPAEGSEPVSSASLPAAVIDDELAFLHALEYKRRRRWPNVYVTRRAIHEFLTGHVRIRARASLFDGGTQRDCAVLQSAALGAVEKGLERFTYAEQRTRETSHLATQVVTDSHPNFPRPRAKDGDDSPGYILAVPEALLDGVDEIVSGLADGSITAHDDMSEPVPRLFMDEHLYGPLFAAEAEVAAAGARDIFAFHQGVRSTPTGLVKSEITFIKDLRDAWKLLSAVDGWDNYELSVLRNLPKRGVGFFSTAGFYPDFMLWMKSGESQVLAFVEPHGMVIWDPVKVELLEDIRKMELDLPLLAYIVTGTQPRSVGAIGGRQHLEEWFKERHILFQDGTGYVDTILTEMRATLELMAAGLRAEEGASPTSPEPTALLTIVPGSADIEPQKFETMLPMYSLAAAAGRFGAGESVEVEGWVEVPGRTLSRDMFVARAVGHSMEPRISNGDLCIFRGYRGGTRRDRIMLFQWQGAGDPDTGGSYAVKKFFRQQELVEDDELVGVRVTLSSLNPEYDPIVIEAEYADDIVAIAEYVDSLGSADER
ncbi:MAG: S24 family peptidase [Actinomycetota bacterium]|nr:S24 family peptidase [Actinomycetota bacterium]